MKTSQKSQFPHLHVVQNRENICRRKFWLIQYTIHSTHALFNLQRFIWIKAQLELLKPAVNWKESVRLCPDIVPFTYKYTYTRYGYV